MSEPLPTRESLLALYDPEGPHQFAAYSWHDYRMMPSRLDELRAILVEDVYIERAGCSFLDVSCGRGESLRLARELGYGDVRGTEAVPSLVSGPSMVRCVLPDVPFGDGAFDVVTCVDVLEHLLLADWEPSVRSLARVCGRRLILCVSNVEDTFGARVGAPLHVSRIPYDQTLAWLREWAPGFGWEWVSGEEGDDGAWYVGERE